MSQYFRSMQSQTLNGRGKKVTYPSGGALLKKNAPTINVSLRSLKREVLI